MNHPNRNIKALLQNLLTASLLLALLPSAAFPAPPAPGPDCAAAFNAPAAVPPIAPVEPVANAALPVAEWNAETTRFNGDALNESSLNALRAGMGDPLTAQALRQYLALSNSGTGGLSVYPAELKQIMDTWSLNDRQQFVASLTRANQLRATGMTKENAMEQALTENGLLARYRANKTIISLGVIDNVQLEGADQSALNNLADQNGVPRGSVKQVLSAIYMKIALQPGDPLAKSEQMAAAAQPLLQHISSLSENDRSNVQLAVGTCVLRLEEFQHEDFVPRQVTANYPILHYKDYAEWVKSFVAGTAPYANAQPGGLLNITDIRDFMSQNYWPVGMRPHDTRHVHYAVGHPQGVVLTLESARSRNLMRHRLMGALYESVDTIQYGYERALSQYFRAKGMTIDQGLLYVSTATQAQINELVAVANTDSSFMFHANSVQNWVPATDNQYDGMGVTGTGLEAESDAFIREMARLKQNPANRPWMNYNYQTNTGQGHVDEDDPNKH